MTFVIERLVDWHDCEDCGLSTAEGYIIRKDGIVIVDKTPHAWCFGDKDYSRHNAHQDILEHLEVEVQVVINEEDDIK